MEYIFKKRNYLLVLIILILVLVFLFLYLTYKDSKITKILPPKPLPFLVYSFDNLKNTNFPASQISLDIKTSETSKSQAQLFYYSVPKTPGKTDMEKVSGLINTPKKPGVYPVIIMFRGFIPAESYKSGSGTEHLAQILADDGFITIAPDFLGFGNSDKGSDNGFENRFQTYPTALTLLSSLPNLNSGLEASYSGEIKADLTKVGIWGHSNGGHIALSTLAISGVTYPTVLWAPVSKPFPYSILYYSDESADGGKELRLALSNFEQDYDTDLFDPTKYFAWIKAPIEINQGLSDQDVPVWWSDLLVKTLKNNNLDITYITYPGSDHNLLPNGWNTAAINTEKFYRKYFSK